MKRIVQTIENNLLKKKKRSFYVIAVKKTIRKKETVAPSQLHLQKQMLLFLFKIEYL